MSSVTPLEMLQITFKGNEISSGRNYSTLRKRLPQAWKFWEYDSAKWAVFNITSDRLTHVDVAGAKAAIAIGVRPVFVAPSYDGVRGIAKFYREVQPHVICRCGGVITLLNAPNFPAKRKLRPVSSETRIPLALLERIVAKGTLPAPLRRSLVVLKGHYEDQLRAPGNNDVAEQDALLAFSSRVLDEMGLDAKKLRAARMVRTIESGELGAQRDHFFHSFQNYFFGLEIIAENPTMFEAYWQLFAADLKPEPFDVWFLTALWHDTGYALQKSGKYYRETLGTDLTDDDARALLQRFLKQASVENGLRQLSSLTSHLLFPRNSKRWDVSAPVRRLQGRAAEVQAAFRNNTAASHGALGALRLFADFEADVNRLDSGKADVLKLAIQIAGCSMPFHDLFFRESVRTACGECLVNPDTLPFAALLAFVDSIQDDRRDLSAVSPGIPTLSRLQVNEDGLVTAQLNLDAVPDEQLLPKIVEARDILITLDQSSSKLRFEFPDWMTF